MQSTQTKLTSWEVLTLKKLSEAYLMQYKDDGINSMPPFVKERKAVSMDRVKSVFGGISTVKSSV